MKKDVKKSDRNFKLTKKSVVLLCFIAIILISATTVLYFVINKENNPESDQIYYYPARYDEDIFSNQAYLGFEKGLLYSESGISQMYYYDKDAQSASSECRFFLDYFKTVTEGNYQNISKFYVDGFFDQEPKFTMQMIYEPYVLFHSVGEEEIDGENIKLYNFEVRYKIFKNNGTFRDGVASNTAVPQIYQLVKTDDQYKIFRILDIEYEN